MARRPREKLLTWTEVEAQLGDAPAHVLLANGFSISCWPGFAYRTLLDVAALEDDSAAARAFEALGSQDFEEVIDKLDQARRLVGAVGGSAKSRRRLGDASQLVRGRFLQALSAAHPETPFAVTDFGARAAGTLGFLDRFDHVFTLNYDLLLPWLAMQSHGGRRLTDGFSNDTGPLRWKKGRRQRLWFLHGALHLIDEGPGQVGKAKHQPGRTLVEQLRDRIVEDRWPLVVFEGTAAQKRERIEGNAYLRQAVRRLSEIKGALVVFGASFADSDAHIREVLARHTSLHTVYVSAFGNPASVRRLREAVDDVDGEIEVVGYAAASVGLWEAAVS